MPVPTRVTLMLARGRGTAVTPARSKRLYRHGKKYQEKSSKQRGWRGRMERQEKEEKGVEEEDEGQIKEKSREREKEREISLL